jgi:protein-S-isoprenylcysteine O-methyltransferase Ste14
MILALRLGGLLLWLSMVGYLIYPPLLAPSQVGLPDWSRWLGVGLGVLSVVLIYWMFSSIGAGITPTVATRSEHKLVTSGPYRWTGSLPRWLRWRLYDTPCACPTKKRT